MIHQLCNNDLVQKFILISLVYKENFINSGFEIFNSVHAFIIILYVNNLINKYQPVEKRMYLKSVFFKCQDFFILITAKH